MSSEQEGAESDDREARLDAVTAAYIEAQEAGEGPDGREWVARYPELAPELTQFIEGKDFVDRVVAAIPVEPLLDSWLGDYRVGPLIGRGGMGVVYEAVDPSGLRVALKILPSCALSDPRDRERFHREAAIIADLDHPNIIKLLDVGEQAGIPFVVMPWIDGPNLRSVIHRLRHNSRVVKALPPVSLRVALPHSPDEYAPLESDQPRWRAVALIGLQAARALAHAHDRGVLHRDIKPSNLLLGPDGVIHVADFGLARSDEHPDLTETGDVAGTLRFTAPERFRRWCDNRSDLYSLGLTLYELLTLCPAFDAPDRGLLLRALIEDIPTHPRSLVREIPRDLETIVLKVIEKEPGHRYQSAADLADDLERYLDGHPIVARRLNPTRRAWSWASRHKLRSGVLVVAMLLPFAAAATWVAFEQLSAETANAHAKVAQVQLDSARVGAREAQFQSLVIKSQQNRSGLRLGGWRNRGWDLVNQTVVIHPGDPTVRDQVLATLAGLDALLIPQLDYGASSLAFDGSGKLLLGGLDPEDRQDDRTKLLDIATKEIRFSDQIGPGPVAFLADGAPVQLARKGKGVLVLRDIASRRDRARYEVPGGGEVSSLVPAADGSRMAAATETAVHVWDGLTGRLLVSVAEKAGALAISPDGRLLALGSDSGRVRVVSLPEATQAAEFPTGRRPIQCLAFGLDPRREPDGRHGWLLAAGGSGNPLVVYDLTNKTVKSINTGHDGVLKALAFSPDGSILAEVGLGATLRDVASGRPILRLAVDHLVAVAFSPDGRRLALTRRKSLTPGMTAIFDLEPGQGMLTMRGLDSPISRVAFARDGSVVAALAESWQAAVWELPSGRLRLVVDAPLGLSGDNCALAVSPDGRLLALSAGREAQLWDLVSCRRIKSWPLPPGLVDQLGFPSSDRLLSFRAEPPTGTPPPRVGLIRDLLGPVPLPPLGRTPPFSPRVLTSTASPDGRFFAVEGIHDLPSGPRRWCRVYDGTTGKELWSRPNEYPGDYGLMAIDSAGLVLAIMVNGEPNHSKIFELTTGRPRDSLPGSLPNMGPGAVLWAVGEPIYPEGSFAIRVLRRGRDEILARLPSDEGDTTHSTMFSPDGRFLAYGHADGTVTFCDLEAVRRKLGELDLNW